MVALPVSTRSPATPAAGDVPAVRCHSCLDSGFACEDHPQFPWADLRGPIDGHANCGGAGMPCPACCSAVPADGTRFITDAFIPDWARA